MSNIHYKLMLIALMTKSILDEPAAAIFGVPG
jgi:hypothetical protein